MSFKKVGDKLIPYLNHTTPRGTSGSVVTGNGIFYGFVVSTDGTNDVTMTFRDSTVISGTTDYLLPADITIKGTDNYAFISTACGNTGISFDNGIYVDLVLVSGSCSYEVLYEVE